MEKDGAPPLQGDSIVAALSNAGETARLSGESLKAHYSEWISDFEFLSGDSCPITYLPVVAVLLTARSLRPKSELDVLDIKQSTSQRGYAAPSIAAKLIPFALEAGIDLRSKSTQVMNNQPFIYKERITPEMSGKHKRDFYARFYGIAERVNDIDSPTAADLLALVFWIRRSVAKPSRGRAERHLSLFDAHSVQPSLDSLIKLTSTFVNENSESGKVGQAFSAALLDLLFPSDLNTVRMVKNNDPSVNVPGDIQVGGGDSFWLWAEVRQKPVVNSAITSFVDRVAFMGGDRVVYFALVNFRHPDNIRETQLLKHATRSAVELTVYQEPEQAMRDLLRKCAGSSATRVGKFLERMEKRLQEANVSEELRSRWSTLVDVA